MPLIAKEAPKVKSEVIKTSSLFINAPEVAVNPSNSVLIQNYLIPICDRQEDMMKLSTRADGLLIAGSRVPISIPYGSIKEIHLD